MPSLRVEELNRSNQSEARSLVLAGLADHWGSIDETLNPDLDDMTVSYQAGRTVLMRNSDDQVVGTGTLLPRQEGVAEILRMSVAATGRRRGIGRQIVEELLSTATEWGVELVVLETTSSWDEVISFYLSCGFTVTHVEEGEFGSDTWFQRRLGPKEQIDGIAMS